MEFIKKLFSKTSETFRKLIKKFPVTLAIIVFATLFMTIDINQDVQIFDKIMLFSTVFAVESFFTEVCIYEKKSFRIIGYLASALIAIGFTVLVLGGVTIYKDTISRILLGYLIILFMIAIYKIIKENGVNFQEYLLKVFANMFNSTITYLVLNLGLTLITVIFVELLLNAWGDILLRIQVLLLGLFYVPALLNSVWDVKEKEVNTFFKGLVKFVLLPLVSVAMVIIYMYIIKILVLRQMPSNVIFRILAGIFVVAFPVWNMARNFQEDSKFIEKLTKLLPYFYMPFILLEIYSLYARISEFGITPVRYFGIAFIVMQVITLILTVIKKGENLSHTFIYMAVLALISFVLPLNYSKVSILSQSSILKSEFPESSTYSELSKESKIRISGAYKYLVRNDASEYIPEYIKQYKEDIYNNYYDEDYDNFQHIYFDNSEMVDIREYSKLTAIYTYGDSANLEFYATNNRNNIMVATDIGNLLENAIHSGNAEEYLRNNSLIKIDDTRDIYIRNLRASYNEYTNEVDNISVDAYLLFR